MKARSCSSCSCSASTHIYVEGSRPRCSYRCWIAILPPNGNPSQLCYFPCLPELRAPATYKADSKKATNNADSCRKLSYGHPTRYHHHLLPTCMGYICYGFEVMARCESPRLPFLFTTMFPRSPKVIVYDNACKLHIYCLNLKIVNFNQS